MNPIFEKIQSKQARSIYVKDYQLSHFDIPYHYHPEVEIVYFKEGTGKVFVEHSMTTFEKGNLFIFGPNVPHLIVEDKKETEEIIDILVIQFEAHVFGDCLKLPEFDNLNTLMNDANSGIKFKNLKNSSSEFLLQDLLKISGLECFLLLMRLLDALKVYDSYKLIGKYHQEIKNVKIPDRLQRVNQYILKNYNSEISLDVASQIANMNKASFCRYFKKHTRKSFGEYINAMRIDYACKLLIEGSLNISSICYEVGFNSFPYFIKLFKRSNGITPKQYRLENSMNNN